MSISGKIFLFIVTILTGNAQSSYLGNYKNTSNLPGYINLDPKSDTYQGAFEDDQKDDGINRDTPSQIVAKLMKGTQVDPNKINLFIESLQRYEIEAMKLFCQKEMTKKGFQNAWCTDKNSLGEIKNEWAKEPVAQTYNFARHNFIRAKELATSVNASNINTQKAQAFLAYLFDAIETYEMIKGEDEVMGHLTGLRALASKVYHFLLEKPVIKNNRPKSSNLLRISGVGNKSATPFYSESELNQLQNEGYDLSLLNPPDSGFWRKPVVPIKDFDSKNFMGLDRESLSRVLTDSQIADLVNSKRELKLTLLNKLPRGGASPKVDVSFGKAKFKMKFVTHRHVGPVGGDKYEEAARYFQNSELEAEQVVNHLAAAVGFSVEPAYFKEKVRLYFPEEVYQNNAFESEHKNFLNKLEKRFSYSWNVSSAFQNIKIDEQGKKYMELRTIHLEMRSVKKGDINIGSFRRSGLGKSLKREHRAFSLFAAWIMDTGVKDENDKGKLIPVLNEDGAVGYKLALMNSDMGASLGLHYPNLYNFNFIKNVTYNGDGSPESIELNYPRAFALKTLSAIDIDDAKWMARLIGQFTQQQIKNIFLHNGHPELVSEYYSQIMMKKRNQLLMALKMIGKKTIDSKGDEVALELEKDFKGSIPGFEKYFRDGKLTDPQNNLYDREKDPFPRYWGADFKQFGGDPTTKITKMISTYLLTTTVQTVHGVLLNNVAYTNQGFNLFPLNNNIGSGVSPACQGNCFVDGIQYGLNSFLPMRYLIPNPFKDPAHKYWWVEVFRIGAFIGHNGQGLLQELGMGAADNLGLGVIGKFYKMGEYIKIHPVKDEETLLTHLPSLLKITALPLRHVRRSLVSKMEEGEVLIHSSYIGAGSSIVVKPLSTISPVNLGPSIRLNGDKLAAHRVTLLKNKNHTVLANWSKLKQSVLSARVNMIDFFIQIPLLEAQFKKLAARETTFEFDFKDATQRDLLLDNIGNSYPENIPTPLLLEHRTTDLRQRSLSFGLFGLLSSKKYLTKIAVDYKNYRENISASDLVVEKKKISKKFRNTGFINIENKIKASINSKDGMYAKISINHHYPAATREDFVDIYERYFPILPDYFITFNPHAVSHYVGDMDTEIEAIYSQNALNQIFAKNVTQYSLCMAYAKFHRFEEPHFDCEKMNNNKSVESDNVSLESDEQSTSDVRHFKRLYKRYIKAKNSFWQLAQMSRIPQKEYRKNAYRALENIVDMLNDSKYFEYRSMKFFISLISKDSFYRKANFKAKMEAFPGHEDTIEEHSHERGNFEPTLRMLSSDPAHAFEIFSDRIHQSVAPYMLNFVSEI